MRSVLKRTRTEHEHETATATVTPFHPSDAADPGVNRAPQNVEPDDIADVNAKPFDDVFFDRDFGKRPRRLRFDGIGEPTLDERLVGFEMTAIRDRVFP